MKKLIAMSGFLLLAFGAQADTCRNEMVDYHGYVRLIITQGQPNWTDRNCYWSYQQCLATIRLNPAMRPSCRVVQLNAQNTPRPQPPTPNPNPTPRPQWNPGDDDRRPSGPPRPGTSNGRIQPAPRLEVDLSAIDTEGLLLANGEATRFEIYEGRRAVEVGETVIKSGATYTVVSAEGNQYEIQLEGSRKKKDLLRVKREEIAITRGCALNVCVTDPVYIVPRGRVEAVVGLTASGDLVTKNIADGKLSEVPVKLKEVALGKGCVQHVCVGNVVQGKNNSFFEVLAIQNDKKLVLKQERGSSVIANVDPAALIVVR